MKQYHYIDYTCIEDVPDKVLDFAVVSSENIARIKKAVPHDQRDQVKEDDELEVYAVRSSDGDGKRRLTIWFNRCIAAVETSNGSIWGEWDEDEELLMTGEFEQAQDIEGSPITGRRAYNIYGIPGIYALGRFYTLVDGDPEGES